MDNGAQPHGKAIVTGPARREEAARSAPPANWRTYAERHGYDLHVLSRAETGTAWWTLPSLAAYDSLVWIDPTVIINPAKAPCIVSRAAPDKIAMPAPQDDITPSETVSARQRKLTALWHGDAAPIDDDGMAVFVFRPADHATTLTECARRGAEMGQALRDTGLVADLCPRFNADWPRHAARHYPFLFDPAIRNRADIARKCANTFYHNNYFCRFPTDDGLADTIDQACGHIFQTLFPDDWQRRGTLFYKFAPQD